MQIEVDTFKQVKHSQLIIAI